MSDSKLSKDEILGDDENNNDTLPASLSQALSSHEKPQVALSRLAQSCQQQAHEMALALVRDLEKTSSSQQLQQSQHSLDTATASADSIYHSLLKIASGGSQASHEIRELEQQKDDVDAHAKAVAMALTLRKASEQALQAWQTQQYAAAAQAVRVWQDWKVKCKLEENNSDESSNKTTRLNNERCSKYAGEYALQQLAHTYNQLKTVLLEHYQEAVNKSDLQTLGKLTPVLGIINLEQQAVELYLQFLTTILESSMDTTGTTKQNGNGPTPPFVPMAHVYNAAVVALRHHLPMVSHCLYKAKGDAAVVQLVHAQVEKHALGLLKSYQSDHQLEKVARHAQRIYALLEEQYTGRSLVDDEDDDHGNNSTDNGAEDGGFSKHIGSLSDVDVSLEEAAMVIQHAERYLRFVQHTCAEVNRAQELRWQHSQQQARYDRERQEWSRTRDISNIANNDDDDDEEYKPVEILPSFTALHQAIAELGGQYASIERCLLLTSLQRAFSTPETDPRYYRPLSVDNNNSNNNMGSNGNGQYSGLQTSLVEACWYATRRGPQRALATGHTGTASAVINFVVDCLNGVMLEVLSHRAEDSGVAVLKPGEGLLIGSAGIFNATNLMRQGGAGHLQAKDDIIRRKKVQEDIAKACAVINDLEVAVQHSRQLESTLQESVKNGFAQGTHETEQLSMCVKSISTVTDSFKIAADAAIESLESILKSRIRSIVGEAVGGEGTGAGSLLGSSVISGNKAVDKVTVRMNYNLDEEAYNMSQLSEGYVARLCTLLDELLDPLRTFLAPRLWDTLWMTVMSTVSKRLETSLRKCEYTPLGALALEADLRDLWNYTKDRLVGTEYTSYSALGRGCHSLQRLLQIAKLLNVDDLDDVLDLITVHKRKGNWDIKLEETKAFLMQRVDFEKSRVNELLQLSDDD